MIRTATCAAMMFCAAGCLGDLVKPPAQDGGTSDGDGGAGRDGAADPDAGDTVAFPGDLAIRITTLVVDLNDNGKPDLVLLNDPAATGDRGVLVFFDRSEGFFDAPDQYLPTNDLHPLVATTGDFVGGAALDLMVVANADDDTPYVVLFEGSGDSTFTQGPQQGFPGRTITAGTVVDSTPVFAARTFLRGSTDFAPALVLGDSDLALTVSPDDWNAVSSTDDVLLDVGTTTMNFAAGVPSAEPDREDLFVVDNEGGIWLENNGSTEGGYQAGPTDLPGWPEFNRAFFFFDFQVDGIPDFITLDRTFLDVGRLAWDGELTMDVDRLTPEPSFGDSFGDALFAADIDGIPGMDFLILDDVKPGSPDDEHFGVHAARNIEIDESGAFPVSGRVDVDASHLGDPTRLVAGDFDGDGVVEVWVFDPSLTTRMCLVGEVYQTDHYRFNECD